MQTMRMIMLATAIAVLATPAFAQQGPPPGGPMGGQFDDDTDSMAGPGRGGPGGPPNEERREEIRKKVEAVRIWRLTEELKLDSQTSARLAALLGSIDSQRAALTRENQENMRALREQIVRSGKTDERKLKTVLDKLERNHRDLMELRDREWKGLKEILTAEQQARYVLFQQRFMREMRGMMDGARGGQGQGMQGGQGPGMRGSGPGRGGMGPGMGPGPGGQGRPPQ